MLWLSSFNYAQKPIQQKDPFINPPKKYQHRIAAISINNLSAFETGYLGYLASGLVFQNSSLVNPANNFEKPDFNAASYIGLGNQKKYLGLGLNFNLYGLSNTQGQLNNFGEGTIDIQISRALSDYVQLGTGILNAVQWKAHHTNSLRSIYIVINWAIPLLSQNKNLHFIYLTAGLGNGKFQNRKTYLELKNESFNFFASAAIQLFKEGNLILEWTGADLTIATAFFPFKKIPIHFVVGISDLNYSKKRYIASLSYSFLFGKNTWNKQYPPKMIQAIHLSPQ